MKTKNEVHEHLLSNLTCLPFSFSELEIEEGQRPVGFRFSKNIINIKANFMGKQIIATGVDELLDTASAKTFSEFVERLTLLSFGHKYEAENSNGWAAHPKREQARLNAIFELIERDAVLAQWYSSTPFLVLEHSHLPSDIQLWAEAELSWSEFPILKILISTKGLGPSVTCLLINKNRFGVSAHSSKFTLDESIRSAISEVCRPAHASIRREHWKSALKLKSGIGDPASPEAHSVFYAYHEAFPSWMFGGNITWQSAQDFWTRKMPSLELVDTQFEFTQVLDSPLFVGFASHEKAFRLGWGSTDIEAVSALAGSQRMLLKPNQVNKEVHIVS